MRWFVPLLGAVLGNATLLAQQSVVVKSGDGRALSAAHVSLIQPDGNTITTLITDAAGEALVPDTWFTTETELGVKVSYIGFATQVGNLRRGQRLELLLLPENQFLNEVVVTAQYEPQSQEKAVHKVRIITAEKVEAMAAVSLADVLSNELNVRLSQDAVLGAGMSMQGVSGENVKILVDGVPVIGRQNGNIDLRQINLSEVERIEIVEGPMGVSYGTNALAGAINLITKKPETNTFSAGVYSETIGTLNAYASAAFRNGQNGLRAGIARNFFDGWDDGETVGGAFRNPVADTTRPSLWKPREQNTARIVAVRRTGKSEWELSADALHEIITSRGLPLGPYYEQANDDIFRTLRHNQQLAWRMPSRGAWSAQAVAAHNLYTRTKNTYATDLTTLERTLTANVTDQDTTQFRQYMSRGSAVWQRDSSALGVELGYDANGEWGTGRRLKESAENIYDVAFYTTAEWRVSEQITLRPGLRMAYNSAYRAPLLPSLNLRWQFGKFTLRAAYARGFRAPSLKELYFEFVDVNHNIVGSDTLLAERSHHFNGSLRLQHVVGQSILQGEVAGFYNRIRDLIALAQNTSTQFTYRNIGEQQTLGGTAQGSMLVHHLKLSAGGGYTGVVNSLSDSTGMLFYPEATASATLKVPKLKTDVSLFYKYQGALPTVWVDELGQTKQQRAADFSMADVLVSRPFAKERITVTAGVKNLFDVTTTVGTASGGVHSGGSTTLVSTGRMAVAKLELNLKKAKA